MPQRNQADQDAGAGEVSVECVEKTGVRDFEFCAQGDSPVLQGQERLPEEECSSQDQGMAVWLILNGTWKSKMEIPVKFCPPERTPASERDHGDRSAVNTGLVSDSQQRPPGDPGTRRTDEPGGL
jgi:hypothetical protein